MFIKLILLLLYRRMLVFRGHLTLYLIYRFLGQNEQHPDLKEFKKILNFGPSPMNKLEFWIVSFVDRVNYPKGAKRRKWYYMSNRTDSDRLYSC